MSSIAEALFGRVLHREFVKLGIAASATYVGIYIYISPNKCRIWAPAGLCWERMEAPARCGAAAVPIQVCPDHVDQSM